MVVKDKEGKEEIWNVEWAAAGLCHSDEHFRSGDRVPSALADALFPMLGGHEGAGTVVAPPEVVTSPRSSA